jgi:hypothetical protein
MIKNRLSTRHNNSSRREDDNCYHRELKHTINNVSSLRYLSFAVCNSSSAYIGTPVAVCNSSPQVSENRLQYATHLPRIAGHLLQYATHSLQSAGHLLQYATHSPQSAGHLLQYATHFTRLLRGIVAVCNCAVATRPYIRLNEISVIN